MKQKWETPKLIVLVRGKSEERVLEGCKIGSSGYGPEVFRSMCLASDYCPYECTALNPS